MPKTSYLVPTNITFRF
uniref:Uncharacterized protein n=1 Tax=Arundo donax TaxID=35708 RepID=A0A0A8Z7P7_ARUDO